jgi:hypothetical protein
LSAAYVIKDLTEIVFYTDTSEHILEKNLLSAVCVIKDLPEIAF